MLSEILYIGPGLGATTILIVIIVLIIILISVGIIIWIPIKNFFKKLFDLFKRK